MNIFFKGLQNIRLLLGHEFKFLHKNPPESAIELTPWPQGLQFSL